MTVGIGNVYLFTTQAGLHRYKIAPVHTMNFFFGGGAVELYLHSFLISELERGQGSTSGIAPLPPGENSWYESHRILDGLHCLISIADTLYKLPAMLMPAFIENHNCALQMSGVWVPLPNSTSLLFRACKFRGKFIGVPSQNCGCLQTEATRVSIEHNNGVELQNILKTILFSLPFFVLV